jgi:hypothetical protein
MPPKKRNYSWLDAIELAYCWEMKEGIHGGVITDIYPINDREISYEDVAEDLDGFLDYNKDSVQDAATDIEKDSKELQGIRWYYQANPNYDKILYMIGQYFKDFREAYKNIHKDKDFRELSKDLVIWGRKHSKTLKEVEYQRKYGTLPPESQDMFGGMLRAI